MNTNPFSNSGSPSRCQAESGRLKSLTLPGANSQQPAGSLGMLAVITFVMLACLRAQAADASWWNSSWRFRVPIQVNANGVERLDKPAEVVLNLTALLQERQVTDRVNQQTFLGVEVDAQGSVVNEAVSFQFDPAADYQADTNAAGTLVLLLPGATATTATRRFLLYFDSGDGLPPAAVTNQVSITNVSWQDQSSFQITTPGAIYYYHIYGAGFASMLDQDGKDWISYRPSGGSAGSYRGIPNLVHPEGFFHHGNTNCTSLVVSVGPLKVKVYSESNDKKWACEWEFYPSYAKMTVLKTNAPYWFLYEGTPGGALDDADFVVRSPAPGTRTTIWQSWVANLPAPEWICFGDTNKSRMLYLVHHEDTLAFDSYWQMENNMTVFGFGRRDLLKYLKQIPAHFTIGFARTNDLANITRIIDAAYRDLAIAVGP